jgi:hypothetical protein
MRREKGLKGITEAVDLLIKILPTVRTSRGASPNVVNQTQTNYEPSSQGKPSEQDLLLSLGTGIGAHRFRVAIVTKGLGTSLLLNIRKRYIIC